MVATGGARCIASLDVGVGGSSNSPWIVSGGKGGDVAVHDFRFILSQKGKRPQSPSASNSKNDVDETGKNGMLWHVPKAHAGNSQSELYMKTWDLLITSQLHPLSSLV